MPWTSKRTSFYWRPEGNYTAASYGQDGDVTFASDEGYWLGIYRTKALKDEKNNLDLDGLDSDHLSVDDYFLTTETFGADITIFPQHGVPFALITGTDQYQSDVGEGTDVDFHGLMKLPTVINQPEKSWAWCEQKRGGTTGDHTVDRNGCVVLGAEYHIIKGAPSELTLDVFAQNGDTMTNTTDMSYMTGVTQLKYDTRSTGANVLQPYAWKHTDCYLGSETKVTSWTDLTLKWDLGMLSDDYTLDSDNANKVARPVYSGTQKYTMDITGRMNSTTFYNNWVNNTLIGQTTAAVDDEGHLTNSQTDITYETLVGTLPPVGILHIDDEYMFFHTDSGTVFTVVRGAYGSTAATHQDEAVINIYGTACVIQSKGTDVDFDDDDDYIVFSMWGGKVWEHNSDTDVQGDVREESFTYTPRFLVVSVADQINADYWT